MDRLEYITAIIFLLQNIYVCLQVSVYFIISRNEKKE